MMPRVAIFDAIRKARGFGFSKAEVFELDAVLDGLRVPRGPGEGGDKRTVSREGIKMMHEYEGLRLEAYPDPGSKDGHPWTIGRGATGEGIHKGVRWTQAQCDARFEQDLARFSEGVAKLLGTAPTTPNQYDALVSFSYNVGLHALRNSTLLRKHKAGDYEGAAKEFARWVNNDGKPMKGLVRRRAAEAARYRGAI